MKVRAISEFGYQLTRFGLFNCYLVREADGLTLIDTGIPGSAKDLMEGARGLGLGSIRRVLLTHAHNDHVGSVDALVAALANEGEAPELASGRREARLLVKPPDLTLDAAELAEAPGSKIRGGPPGVRTPVGRLLEDGELYGSLRTIATPGHTPGHCSFLDERDGTLYAGDAVLTVGGQVHIPGYGPWYFPFAALANWHKPTVVKSVRRLAEVQGVRRIAAGHGPVLEGSGLLAAAVLSTGA